MMVARARIQPVGSGLLGSPRRFPAVRHKLLSAGARLSASVDRARLPLRESRQIGTDYFRRLRSGGFRFLQSVALRETLKMAPLGGLAISPGGCGRACRAFLFGRLSCALETRYREDFANDGGR